MLETALIVRDALDALKMPSLVKTTGSKGLHVYVPIVRGPAAEGGVDVREGAGAGAGGAASGADHGRYRIAKRPQGRVLVDYNQNAWGRTLASIYSVRPRPEATVSTPVTWKEVERGVRIEDFTVGTCRRGSRRLGDLWKPLLAARGRVDLARVRLAPKSPDS